MRTLSFPTNSARDVKGTLRGRWGFDSFEGPAFHLQNSHAAKWVVPAADQSALIVGRDDVLHVESDAASCVEHVSDQIRTSRRKSNLPGNALKPNELEIHVPLKDAPAGPLKLAIRQYGRTTPDEVSLHAYTQAATTGHFQDQCGRSARGADWNASRPGEWFRTQGHSLRSGQAARAPGKKTNCSWLPSQAPPPAALQPEEKLTARVDLKDGRILDLQTTVEPPRPKVDLISKNVQPG